MIKPYIAWTEIFNKESIRVWSSKLCVQIVILPSSKLIIMSYSKDNVEFEHIIGISSRDYVFFSIHYLSLSGIYT